MNTPKTSPKTPSETTVLFVGATGSIGELAVEQAVKKGFQVRALVRDRGKAERLLGTEVELVVGDLTQPDSLHAAVVGVDAVVLTHGSSTRESDVRDIDYAGVANILTAAKASSEPASETLKIILMAAVGVTRPGMPYATWKWRGEQLVRASGFDYTIVRPGWFDYNDAGQRQILMRQGDTKRSASPSDGVIARDEIARVLVESILSTETSRKTFEIEAIKGPEQQDLSVDFSALQPDSEGSLYGVEDSGIPELSAEPQKFLDDLSRIQASKKD